MKTGSVERSVDSGSGSTPLICAAPIAIDAASLDVRSFVTSPQTLALVPVFLAAILIARGLPAPLYRPLLSSRREVMTAGLLQATSLSIPIVGGTIGVGLGLIRPENYIALVAAGTGVPGVAGGARLVTCCLPRPGAR
jgi:Kef-type K+ transport system membrane component KefB